MATEYNLALAGSTTVEEVAERAFPDPAERPTGTPPLLSAGLWDQYGFAVSVLGRKRGYFDLATDDGVWEWEPEQYVLLSFQMEKNTDTDRALTNMLTVVRRVLDTGPEDAVFNLNGDYLLFSRIGGVLVKHRKDSWWKSYPAANQIIAGR